MKLFRRKDKDETEVESHDAYEPEERREFAPEQDKRAEEERSAWAPPPVEEPDEAPETVPEPVNVGEEAIAPVEAIEEPPPLAPEPPVSEPQRAPEPPPPVRTPMPRFSGEDRVPAIVVALVNQKGGVGKTTTAINLGAELAARGVATLLVDIDPQANSTAGLGLSDKDRTSIYEVLLEETQLEDVIIGTPQEGLDIAPSGPDLAGAEVELVPLMAREQRLLRALGTVAMRYDAVIIDCPPSLGLLTLNALTASDEVLVPVQCEYLALEGLGQLVRTLDAVRRNLNPALHLGGLVLTMFDSRTNLCQQVASEVRAHFPTTFDTVIPRSVRASEAPSHGLPIGQYAPGVPVHKAYAALAEEFIAKLLPHRARAGVMP